MSALYLLVSALRLSDNPTMKVLELQPDDLPLVIKLKLGAENREYLLLKTKQDRLLLNKPMEGPRERK